MTDRNAYEIAAAVFENNTDPFYLEANGLVWKAMTALHNTQRPIDLLTVMEQLKATGDLEAIGGPAAPGVGFGSGIERIILALKESGVSLPAGAQPPILIAHFGGETKMAAVQLVYELRAAGLAARLAFARGKRSMKSQMREANKLEARYVLILGEAEVAEQAVMVRPMAGGEQVRVPRPEIAAYLRGVLA